MDTLLKNPSLSGGFMGLLFAIIVSAGTGKFSPEYGASDIIPIFFWSILVGIIVGVSYKFVKQNIGGVQKRYWMRGGLLFVSIQLGYHIISNLISFGHQRFISSFLEEILFPYTLLGLGIIFAFGALVGWLYEFLRKEGVKKDTINHDVQPKRIWRTLAWILVGILIIPPILYFLPWFLINSYCTIDSLIAGHKTCDNFFDY